MKNLIFKIAIVFTFVTFYMMSAIASEKSNNIDHSEHVGLNIHTSTVDGFSFAYHLVDLPGRQEHHLMVYVTSPDGDPVEEARIGYLVEGPDGSKQKVMAMGMKTAFGADVNLTLKGNYTVKTKALVGNKKLLDKFTYAVE
jgi:hypothetical protein